MLTNEDRTVRWSEREVEGADLAFAQLNFRCSQHCSKNKSLHILKWEMTLKLKPWILAAEQAVAVCFQFDGLVARHD